VRCHTRSCNCDRRRQAHCVRAVNFGHVDQQVPCRLAPDLYRAAHVSTSSSDFFKTCDCGQEMHLGACLDGVDSEVRPPAVLPRARWMRERHVTTTEHIILCICARVASHRCQRVSTT
jgi:hypothetical protein